MIYPLEPDSAQRGVLGKAALAYLTEFIENLPQLPSADLGDALQVAARVRTSVPEAPAESFDEVLELVASGAVKAVDTAGPGSLGHIPAGGLYAAAVADFLATATNRFVAVWSMAPVFAQIEWTALRWLCDLFSYPAEARGILTSGGSIANLAAVVTARRDRLGEDFFSGTLYVTSQTNASVAKAAAIAGLPVRNVRKVATTQELRMDPRALAAEVVADRTRGLRPFCVVASAGTTNTGAVDPIMRIADVARDEGLWLHVDGAYGGPFQMTQRGAALFRGIERADSITLDPHKAMFLPYGTGALLVRQGRLLRQAHHVGAEYLLDLAPEGEIPNFSEYSPELTRDFRGLRVWLPIRLHGLAAFRAALDEKLDLARFLYEELARTPGFDLPWEPELTVVPFRYVPARGDANASNQRLLDRINASKRVSMSSTRIHGQFFIRPCVLSHRTHRDRIEEAVEIIRTATGSASG